MLVARPAAVMISTLGSTLNWRERVFLAWMAPRGIVAAAVSSLFALRMAEEGIPGARELVPVTFLVIVGTVSIYSLTAVPMARWLRVSRPNPQGVLIIGAHALARSIGMSLQKWGYDVILVDTNLNNTEVARALGLPTFHGSAFADELREDIVLAGIGRLLALTPNDEVNALAVLEWAEVFGRAEVYQLLPEEREDQQHVLQPMRGRPLFGLGMSYPSLMRQLRQGSVIETVSIPPDTNQRTTTNKLKGVPGTPLFAIAENGDLIIMTADRPRTSRPIKMVITLVGPEQMPLSNTVEPGALDVERVTD
jgi:hypothetical protein